MYRCPMKLIFSRLGVPSATPAQENNASTRPVHSATAASIDAFVAQIDVDRLGARKLDLGEVHHRDLGARVLHERGDGRPHAGGTTDHEGPLPVVAIGAE